MSNYVYKSEKDLKFPWGFYPAGSYFPIDARYKPFSKYFKTVTFKEYFDSLQPKMDAHELAKERGKFVIESGMIIKLRNCIAITRNYPSATKPQDAHLVCQFCAGGKPCQLKRIANCCNNATLGEKGFVWFDKLDETRIFQRVDLDFSSY